MSLRYLLPILFVVAVGVAMYVFVVPPPSKTDAPPPAVALPPEPPEASSEDVHRVCAACHAYPTPDSFPRSAWRKEVKRGYDFFHQALEYRFDYPPLEAVVRYYEKRAPESLPPLPREPAGECPVKFDRPASAPRPPRRRVPRTSASSACSRRTSPTYWCATP